MVKRRTVIIGIGGSIAVAGCTGDSEEETEYEEGDVPEDDEEESEEEQNEDPSEEDIEIVEHEYVVEEDEYFEEVYVEGVVRNNADVMADYVQVTVRVYDSDGNQLDSYIDNTSDLAGGGTWSFEVMILDDSEDVDDYDIAVEDIRF